MKFSIRDVLWLTVVIALAVGWWLDHSRSALRRDAVISDVDRIREVLNDARTTYAACAIDFFNAQQGNFLAQEPDWGVAEKALDELAGEQRK